MQLKSELLFWEQTSSVLKAPSNQHSVGAYIVTSEGNTYNIMNLILNSTLLGRREGASKIKVFCMLVKC